MRDIDRVQAWMERDFLPSHDPLPASEFRICTALEYSAHHLGRISRNLDRLVELLEKQSAGTTQT